MGLFSRERRWRSRSKAVQSEQNLTRTSGRRLVILRLAVILLFSVLALQLVRFQVLSGGRYQLKAETNRLRLVTTTAPRGLIYDRYHNPLVQNVASYTAVVVPADLPKGRERDIYFQLSGIVGVPPDVIAQKVDDSVKRSDPFTPVKIKEQLDQRTVLTLAELRHSLPGVNVQYDAVRKYSDSTLLSHIFGYVGPITADEYSQLKDRGYQLNDKVGKAGIEYVYEDQLRGTPGKLQEEVDASGRVLQTLDTQPAKPGDNLVLTIDPVLEQHVTDILQQSLTSFGNNSPSGAAIMMDVHTGEILAYVSLPNYDANLFSGPVDDKAFQKLLDDPGKPLLDHAIEDAYPPGSTFKVITGSAALQTGVATTTTTLTSHGYFSLLDDPNADLKTAGPGSIVFDWADLGTLDFYKGLAMSSDIYFYCLAGGCPTLPGGGIPGGGVGQQRLAQFAKDFGLGAKTGIDLPDEATGLIPSPEWAAANLKDDTGKPHTWYRGDTYFMGIGQGYDTATPVQMVRVAAAIANGGDIVRPHVVREIDDANGNVIVAPQRDVVHHVGVSDANLAVIKQAMLLAVEGGSAASGFLPGYHIAGKTGTAEFGVAVRPTGDAVPTNGVYTEHGWYISFAPYDNPQVALVVFHQLGGGAVTAAPTGRKIWDYYFNHYKAGDPNPDSKASPTPSAGGDH
jgi:penicillin-binding protein 2